MVFIANVIVTPDLYDRDRLVNNVIHINAMRLTALSVCALEVRSHDFH
jgi:hypothetical protein